MTDYRFLGLRLRSANTLPGLLAASGHADPDVTVRLGEAPSWETRTDGIDIFVSELEGGDQPALVATRFAASRQGPVTMPGALRLRYGEGITFWLSLDGREVWATWRAPLTFADAMTFLTGPALGVVLRARGVLALHASAVVIRGRAVGFVGPGGAGKSTIAAALGARGHAVLTDDVLALHQEVGGWMAQPAAPQLRIWEDSERLVLGEQSRLAPLTPTWEKRGLSLGDGPGFHAEPAPLGALLLVSERQEDASPPEILPVGGRAAIVSLLANTYTNYLLDAAQRADELRAIGELVRAVRIGSLRVTNATDLDALAAVIDRWID